MNNILKSESDLVLWTIIIIIPSYSNQSIITLNKSLLNCVNIITKLFFLEFSNWSMSVKEQNNDTENYVDTSMAPRKNR